MSAPNKKTSTTPALVLAYAGCTTCKNAIAWLKEHDVPHVVRPIVDEPPALSELERWIPASGVGIKKWLNTSGQSYRALGKEKVDAQADATLVKWLAKDGKLVKRPVLVRGDDVLVGFRPEAYAALFSAVLLLLVAVSTMGCDDKKPVTVIPAASIIGAPPTVPPSAPTAAPVVAAKPSPRFDSPDAALLFGNARKVLASPEQKAKVDALEQTLRDDDAAMKPAVKDLNAEVVSEIKAGKVDMNKLEPRFVAFDVERQARREKETEAVNALWAALTPEQRKTIVADARNAQTARDLASAQAKENPKEAAEQKAEWLKRRTERMAKDLDLDIEQTKKAEPIVAKQEDGTVIEAAYAEAKKKKEPVLAAFESDAFDAKKLDAFKAPGKKDRGPLESGIKLAGQLTAILKPEQREKLAAKFDERMMMAGMTHGGGSAAGRLHPGATPFGRGGRGGHGEERDHHP